MQITLVTGPGPHPTHLVRGTAPLRCAQAAAVAPAARVRADVRHQPFGRILKSGHFLSPRPTQPKGGPVIVLALALPLLMMAALFALDAFEDWLFPPAEPEDATHDLAP